MSATIKRVISAAGLVWKRPSPWLSWWLPLLVAALGKLWVVAGDEPMAQPADSWGFAGAALNLVWGGEFTLPRHPSGFPFIAGLAGQIGLPWRLTLEVLYLGACSRLALSVALVGGSRLAAVILFWLMAWHPWTLSGFREFRSEPLVLVLVTALLGLMFGMLGRPAWEWKGRQLLALGGLLFIWEWSASEDLLVYASYGLFALLALVLARSEPGQSARSLGRIALLLALPVAMVFGLAATVKGVNYQRVGVYAKCQLDEPGFATLTKALHQVKWLPDLAGAFGRRLSEGTWMQPAGEPGGTYHLPLLQHTFDQAATRRAANIYPCKLVAEGSLVVPPGSIDSVALADEEGIWLGASLVFATNLAIFSQGFDITVLVDEAPTAGQLMFLRQGNPVHSTRFRLGPLPPGLGSSEKVSCWASKKESGVDLPETGQTFSYTFNAKVVGPAKQARREFVERHLRENYPALVGFGLVAGFVCLLLGGRPHRVKPAGCCLLLAAGWFTSRALFDGLLDTDFDFGYSGPARFMQWVSPVFILILFLAGALAAGFIRSRMRPPEPGPESKPGGGGV